MVHFLAYEFACLRARRLAFALVLLGAFERFLVGMSSPSLIVISKAYKWRQIFPIDRASTLLARRVAAVAIGMCRGTGPRKLFAVFAAKPLALGRGAITRGMRALGRRSSAYRTRGRCHEMPPYMFVTRRRYTETPARNGPATRPCPG